MEDKKPNKERHELTPEEAVKRKKRAKRRRRAAAMRATFIYILFILVVSVVISYVGIILANDMFAFLKEDKEISVVIPKKATSNQVGDILDKAGVIEYGTFFGLFVSLTTDDFDEKGNSIYTEGTHALNSNMDYRGLRNELQKATAETVRETVTITIPEGYTVEQIGQLVDEAKVISYEDYIDTVVNYKFSHDFLTTNDDVIYQLEGYLFPDTYEFYIDDDPIQVVNKMLNNYNDKVYGEIEEKATELGLSLHEVTTIASLIEREAQIKEEQPKISGVIFNRLASSNYPFLNIDATIQYAVGHKAELTASDLKVDSPYNSYTYKGLPPGPIANPGLNALLAAVNPEEHNYYFYVAEADGYHIFTKNLDEHNAAVAKVRKSS